MESKINWRRIEKALRQCARQKGAETEISEVIFRLSQLTEITGDFSKNRRMLVRLGKVFLRKNPIIWAPCCPDYGHENGCYTFQGMSGGVPLSVKMQIDFLRKVVEIFPNAKPLFLIADFDSENVNILRAVKKTKGEFELCAESSLRATREEFKRMGLGWEAHLMTEKLKKFREAEQEVSVLLWKNEKSKTRLLGESIKRVSRIDLSSEDKLSGAIRDAAQFIALGKLAVEENAVVCNTTAGGMSWYSKTEVAVLHNPTSPYGA